MVPITRIDEYLAAITNDPDAVTPLPEPVTRIDHYLAYLAGENVAELPEPVTRIEAYLAKLCGMDVEIPEAPITRIDFYLAVLNGETVDLPEAVTRIDHYLYNWAEGSSLPWQTFTGNPLQFNAPKAHTLRSVSVEFSPIQSGSGDPSPDNVRPISGWTGVDIYDEPDYDPTASPKLTVTWSDEAGTVYGGTLTVNEDGSCELEAVQKGVDMGSLSWFYNATSLYFYATVSDMKSDYTYASDIKDILMSIAKYKGAGVGWANMKNGDFGVNRQDIRIKMTDYTSTASLVAAIRGQQMVYPLAEPVTYHLPSIDALKALQGINTMWTDGDNLTVEARGEAVNLSALQSLNMLLGGRYVNNHTPEDLTDEEALDIILNGGNR